MPKKPSSRRPDRAAAAPALLAAALRAQSDGVVIAAAEGDALTVVFANPSFGALLGRDAATLPGAAYADLHADPADADRLGKWLPRARPGQPFTGDGFLRKADGGTLSVAWSVAPLHDAEGRLTHVVATYRDQTEKRRLQEALVHAQRLDAVGRLAGGVAHDFNNLMSVINGYCEILAAHVAANPQALREVAEIHNAGRKAAALTQQLLAFSRRQPLNSRVINLNDLVRDNADILRKLLGTAGRLELELAPQLANTRTDPAQFQQVLFNLVLNARDALRDKGCITVTTANREVKPGFNRRATDTPPGHYVVLTVADNGTGMDAETLKHLFEPFFTTKPEGKGTGLGLALVYGVVQQSGGYINVKSAVLVGSTFEVLLPAVSAPVDPAPESVKPLPSVRGSENLLLVEDDEVVRKMVAGILTADGYRVTAIGSFAELPVDALDRPVQLLIAGCSPEMEAAARRIISVYPELRILCTNNSDAQTSLTWMKPDRQMILSKPFALGELLRASRKLLDT